MAERRVGPVWGPRYTDRLREHYAIQIGGWVLFHYVSCGAWSGYFRKRRWVFWPIDYGSLK